MSLSSPAAPALPPNAPGLRTPLRIASVTPKGCHERLYAKNLGLVGKVLGRFSSLTGEQREEAYAAGLWGLWLSCQRFDKSRGFAFSTMPESISGARSSAAFGPGGRRTGSGWCPWKRRSGGMGSERGARTLPI